MLLSPCIPLLFMGEEYAEKAPFQYFVSFSDKSLGEAVREGRSREFTEFGWHSDAPDPQAEQTFLDSKIDINSRHLPEQERLYAFYHTLIRLRMNLPLLLNCVREQMEAKEFDTERTLFLRMWAAGESLFFLYNFSAARVEVALVLPKGRWSKLLDSGSSEWGGKGELAPLLIDTNGLETISIEAHSFVVYDNGSLANSEEPT